MYYIEAYSATILVLISIKIMKHKYNCLTLNVCRYIKIQNNLMVLFKTLFTKHITNLYIIAVCEIIKVTFQLILIP